MEYWKRRILMDNNGNCIESAKKMFEMMKTAKGMETSLSSLEEEISEIEREMTSGKTIESGRITIIQGLIMALRVFFLSTLDHPGKGMETKLDALEIRYNKFSHLAEPIKLNIYFLSKNKQP